MRLLHTSDWHLGQNFYSKSRAAEHYAFYGYWTARRSMKSTPLSWLAIF